MRELLTAAEMQAVEAAAIDAGAVTGRALMERAGAGVVASVAAEWPEGWAGPAVVLCGPGNNGGDGFVVARLLAEAGRDVAVCLWGAVDKLPPDARATAEAWSARGGAVGGVEEVGAALAEAGLVVDALFGIGLTRAMPDALGDLAGAVARARRRGAKVVAVDVPSGLCADSGRVLGTAVAADLTVTFHAEKPGHRLAEGPVQCGAVRVVDLGLAGPSGGVSLVEYGAGALARLAKGAGHKFGHGHAFVLSGGAGYGGAARLAARGALRVGAGLVTLGVPPVAMTENATQLNAIMLTRVQTAESLKAFLGDTRINALCVGPGMALGQAEAELVRTCLETRRPMVIDAGAIQIMADNSDLRAVAHDKCVLTPHDGEFGRVFGDLGKRLAAVPETGPAFSRLDAAREAAARTGCILLLKGADTVIAAPDGRAAVHSAAYGREAGWLATAGSGDVLAGVITGLMARGIAPFEAAQMGAWLHVEGARAFGPGLIAEDLPEMMPAVFRAAGL
jgi:hydroxyethylthiazole kinase-like uncharacterized protein yjeF